MTHLIEVYIQEVTKRLPRKKRQDIARELRLIIGRMLPDDYSKEDVNAALEKLGSPVTLAYGYRNQPMYLIGPRYYDIYITLLKMILPIAAVISLISTVSEYFIGYRGDELMVNTVVDIIGLFVGVIIDVFIQLFFWLTFVFTILERLNKVKDEQPLTSNLKK